MKYLLLTGASLPLALYMYVPVSRGAVPDKDAAGFRNDSLNEYLLLVTLTKWTWNGNIDIGGMELGQRRNVGYNIVLQDYYLFIN